MYKIYINEKPLLLAKTKDLADLAEAQGAKLVLPYMGQPKSLLQPIDLLEKTSDPGAVLIHAENLKDLWGDFKGLYRIIRAAGGLVFNEENQVLAIFRRGFWDLPKGKIDKGEKKKAAAIREVMEETGIKNVRLVGKLHQSWHTYRDAKKTRILKKTYWYRMSAPKTDLVPQTEEDIDLAIWVEPAQLRQKRPLYRSIQDVLQRAGETS